MNAIVRNAPGLTDVLAKLASGVAAPPLALQDAITLYGDDGVMRAMAMKAISAGRAAFWSSATYQSQRALCLCGNLNSGMSFADAMADAYRHCSGAEKLRALDTLVPLNRKAAEALSLAYAGLGTWRDEHELLMRRVRRRA
ncbi:hypothetical protein [Chelativorans sp.]|uniref:hypothetical protein n=1 Tax=Chelativorans sp. TaxID=2203393 RepID=UPI0028124EE0|nr:hypothetical protein [Chelativorans sp.]